LRFAPADRCPKCGKGGGLVDLRDPAARERCVSAIRRKPWWYGAVPISGLLYGAGFLVLAPALGVLVGVEAAQLGLGGAALVLGIGTAGGTWAGVSRLSSKLDAREVRARPVRPLGSVRVGRGAPRTTLTGTVRVAAPMRAAVSQRPCAVFRVRAVASGTEMDDGGGTDFVLEVEGGERVTVELGAGATIDLPTTWVDLPDAIDAESLRWLAERGIELGATPPGWEEAILVPGESATVEGTVEERPVAEGYRGSRTERVLRDLPGSPLVIRRA
jgi:hypothetical protein